MQNGRHTPTNVDKDHEQEIRCPWIHRSKVHQEIDYRPDDCGWTAEPITTAAAPTSTISTTPTPTQTPALHHTTPYYPRGRMRAYPKGKTIVEDEEPVHPHRYPEHHQEILERPTGWFCGNGERQGPTESAYSRSRKAPIEIPGSPKRQVKNSPFFHHPL